MTYDRDPYDRDLNDDDLSMRDDDRDLGMQGDKNRAGGGMEKLKGKVEKGMGKLTGDRSMEAKGNIQQGVGRAERDADDLVDE